MDYVIIADVNCDLTKEVRERFKVEYLKGHIVVNGKDCLSDLDGELFPDLDEFYKLLKNKKHTITTSPASVEEHKACFEKYFKEGKDVIYVAISSAISGTYNFALMAKKELEELYPNRKLAVIDSYRYGTAIGLLAITLAQKREEGLSFDETVKFAEEAKSRIHQMGPMDDLFFLSRKGRVSKGKAFMGTLVGVKPMGDFTDKGMAGVLVKVKGNQAAIQTTVEYIKRTIVNPENQIIFVSDTARKENATKIAELIRKEIKPKEVIQLTCGCAGGCNIGPGLAAAYYFGEPISKDNEKEKAIIDAITAK